MRQILLSLLTTYLVYYQKCRGYSEPDGQTDGSPLLLTQSPSTQHLKSRANKLSTLASSTADLQNRHIHYACVRFMSLVELLGRVSLSENA